MADSDHAPSLGIKTHDQRLRVFVSSTLGELEAERRAARAAIEQLRLHPVMFESGARPHPARAVYRAFLEQSDVFVGIYWQSYGWVGPQSAISGLEDEFLLAEHMPRLLYVKLPAPDREPALSRLLRNIEDEGGPTYKTFADAGELRELLVNDLATLLSERFRGTARRGDEYWSYHLLPEDARKLLTRLTVFAAPFTKESAEAVSGQDAISGAENLAVLLDHNMVSPAQRPDGERAFRLLNMIHHYASERLKNPDDPLDGLENYLLSVLERASVQHGGTDWARRLLDSEFFNLQAVLRWEAQRQRPCGELLRRIGDVWVWLLVRGSLAQATGLAKLIRSWPGTGLRSERDTVALGWLTMVALVNDGQFAARAGVVIDEVLPTARRLEQPSRWAMMLMMRAIARPYAAGSPARAEYEEALAVARDAGDRVVLGYVLSHFGLFLSVDGDPARARGMHEEMLAIARSLGDENQLAEAHYDLALDALAAAEPGAAQSHLATATRRYTEIDHHGGMARCLGALAAVALQQQHPHLAARLTGAAPAARAIGLTPWPTVAEAEDRITKRIRAALPDAEFTADVAQGKAETTGAAFASAWAALADGAAGKGGR